jgi:hypothetical protein
MTVTADDAKKFADAAIKVHEKTGDRWTFGLPIANGGALIAVGGALLNGTSERAIALLLPTAWLLLIGLAAGGIVPLLASRRAFIAYQEWMDAWVAMTQNKPVPPTDPKQDRAVKRFYAWEWRLEILSGTMFISGLAYPLVVFATRYFATGRFLT